jgi:beta-RFAP synthase
MPKCWVKTGARLHLGQLDLNGSLGRLYGGLGLAIDQPQVELTAERENGLYIDSPGLERDRIKLIAQQYLNYYSLPGARINLIQSLPSHCGLGSGTQLALALGFVLTRLYGLTPPILELAGLTDREGSRSSIGVAAFEQGGFLVDGGKPVQAEEPLNVPQIKHHVPPLITRLPFPEEWAVIIAIPNKEEKIFGSREEHAFRSLLPMEDQVVGEICRLLLLKLLPGLAEKDLSRFGQAVTEIQEYLGDYFTPVQGGRFATSQGEQTAKYLLSKGAAGVGQSSWGPAVYAFTDNGHLAALTEAARDFMGRHGQVLVARGLNRGASSGWS